MYILHLKKNISVQIYPQICLTVHKSRFTQNTFFGFPMKCFSRKIQRIGKSYFKQNFFMSTIHEARGTRNYINVSN